MCAAQKRTCDSEVASIRLPNCEQLIRNRDGQLHEPFLLAGFLSALQDFGNHQCCFAGKAPDGDDASSAPNGAVVEHFCASRSGASEGRALTIAEQPRLIPRPPHRILGGALEACVPRC